MTDFIPEIWAQEINYSLKNAFVASSLVNKDYEGDITSGTVNITRPGSINVGTYSGADVTVQAPTSSSLQLLASQSKYFAFEIPKITGLQANTDLVAAYSQEAAYSLANVADAYVFGLYAEAHADNIIANVTLTAANIYDTCVTAYTNLLAKNADVSKAWIAFSPAEYKLLLQADEFIRSTPQGDSVVSTGQVGAIAGMKVYVTNNLTTASSERKVMYGTNQAITFADAISDVVSSEMEKRFGTLVKGLHVYGAKTVKPEALGVIEVVLA
jgi:hypothetical protein